MFYADEIWSVDLPDHWGVEKTPDGVIFYDANGVGAFHITTFYKEYGAVTREDLIEIADRVDLVDVLLPYLNGVQASETIGSDKAYHWWLKTSNHVIYASYICEITQINRENNEREQILQSLKPFRS
ncbi:MAG: hypothetical protein GY814_17280 [Gammaproteobacteria bacterium]|nr:hypothetical protein [Gammaproteobacteria bacterium]